MMGCSVYRYLSLHCADLTATVRPGWGPARPSRAAAPPLPKWWVPIATPSPQRTAADSRGNVRGTVAFTQRRARMSAGATTRGPATVPDQGLP